MIDHASVQMWLDKYVQAWKTYEPQAIRDLFSEDAQYFYFPYAEVVRGREAIVESWLKQQDKPGTYEASYHPIAVEGNLAVANGRSRYFEEDGKTFKTEFDNLYVVRFDDEGCCTEFREWYMKMPNT